MKHLVYNENKGHNELTDETGGGTGKDGKSAYQLAVDNGFIGTIEEWLESLKGKDGLPGIKGGKGDKGDKGEPGDNGTELPISQANQVLSTNNENKIVWENKKGIYESVQFSIPNNGNSHTFQLEGNLELKITKVATNNGKIELKSKVAQKVNLIYTSFRANGIENQAKNGNMTKDEVFPLDTWIFLDGAERNELLWWCPNDVVREVKFWLADDGLKGVFWKNKLT